MAYGGQRLVVPVTLAAILLVACQNTSSTPAVESSTRTAPRLTAPPPSPAPTAAERSKPVTPEAARNIANNCFTCHGPDGRSPGTIPNLSRLSAEQIAGKLKDFKAGTEPSTVMGRHARAYTDAEIEAVASYIASLNR